MRDHQLGNLIAGAWAVAADRVAAHVEQAKMLVDIVERSHLVLCGRP